MTGLLLDMNNSAAAGILFGALLLLLAKAGLFLNLGLLVFSPVKKWLTYVSYLITLFALVTFISLLVGDHSRDLEKNAWILATFLSGLLPFLNPIFKDQSKTTVRLKIILLQAGLLLIAELMVKHTDWDILNYVVLIPAGVVLWQYLKQGKGELYSKPLALVLAALNVLYVVFFIYRFTDILIFDFWLDEVTGYRSLVPFFTDTLIRGILLLTISIGLFYYYPVEEKA